MFLPVWEDNGWYITSPLPRFIIPAPSISLAKSILPLLQLVISLSYGVAQLERSPRAAK